MIKTVLLVPLFIIFLCSTALALGRQELAYGADPAQQLDVYRAQNATNAPIIVMLHGGGWRTGDKRNANVWQKKATHWVGQGYIFISVNTRLLPGTHPVDQSRDLAAAMAFVQQNASQIGGDRDRIILMGHSAGAHVAGLLATRNDLQREASVQRWAGTILLDSAVLDVDAVMREYPSRVYRRAFGTAPDYWRVASPIAFLNRQDQPFLIVCSTLRDTPCPAARDLQRQRQPKVCR